MSNQNQLCEVASSSWTKLRDLYKLNWPENHVGYYTIDNFIRWIQLDPNIKHLKIYSLNEDWSDGTFLVVERYQLFVNTLNPFNDRLTTALNLLNWINSFKVSSFLEKHRQAILNTVKTKSLEKEYDNLTVLYYLPKEEATKSEICCPDDLILKPINEDDAEIIDKFWSNRHQGSLFLLKRLIRWNINVGAYTKNNGELVAWCLRLQTGALGALEVKDSHKRRGIGSLLVKYMTKQLAEIGHDTFSLANEKNESSRRLFEKLNFKLLDNAYWLKTVPLVESVWVD